MKGGAGCSHLVYEEEPLGIDLLSDPDPPGSPQPLVAFHRTHSPFFRLKPSRLNSRRTVQMLRLLPVVWSKKRRLFHNGDCRAGVHVVLFE